MRPNRTPVAAPKVGEKWCNGCYKRHPAEAFSEGRALCDKRIAASRRQTEKRRKSKAAT